MVCLFFNKSGRTPGSVEWIVLFSSVTADSQNIAAEPASGSFRNPTGSDAAGTNLDPFVTALNQRSHGLKVRIDLPLCPVVCVTDVVPDHSVLTAYCTYPCHEISSLFKVGDRSFPPYPAPRHPLRFALQQVAAKPGIAFRFLPL